MPIVALTVTPAEAYPDIKREVRRVLTYAQQVSALLDVNITGQALPDIRANLIRLRDSLQAVATSSNNAQLIQYARDQEDNMPTYDPAAAFIAFRTLINNAIAEIETNFPANTLLADYTGTQAMLWTTFTPAQTAALKADMDAIIADVI